MEIRPFSFSPTRSLEPFSPFRRRLAEGQDQGIFGNQLFAKDKLTPSGLKGSDLSPEDIEGRAPDGNLSELFKKLEKRTLSLTDKISKDFKYEAVKSFAEHLDTLERLAVSLGVDKEDFRAAIRGELDKIGVLDDGNSTIDNFELAAAVQSETKIKSQLSSGEFEFNASVKQSLEFNFTGQFTTKDGSTVTIDASYDLDLQTEVGVEVKNAPIKPTEESGTEFDYRALVGGFLARLKEARAETRKEELRNKIESKKEERERELKKGEFDAERERLADTERESQLTTARVFDGFLYNSVSQSFDFQYTSYVDDKYNRAIKLYKAALRYEEVGVSVFKIGA